MNVILKYVISMSVSASILAIVLFALKPLVKSRLSRTWQYYIWLIVIIRLFIPYTSQINIVGTMYHWFEREKSVNNEMNYQSNDDTLLYEQYESGNQEDILTQEEYDNVSEDTSVFELVKNYYLWLLWLGIAIMILVHKITSYRSFVRYMKSGRFQVNDLTVLGIYRQECTELGIQEPLPLYTNKMATSPMLVGLFKPFIILPDVNVGYQELYHIFIHELTHYKRKDAIYKWITQIALCLHWFNPFIYFVRKEINNNCELSCDEAIIKKLDYNGRRHYGDTLLASVKFNGNYGDTIVSMTLNEDAKILKERLGAIMIYKKMTKLKSIFTIVLTVIMVGGASMTGAYAATNNSSQKADKLGEEKSIKESTKTILDIKSQNTYNIAESGSFQVDSSQTLTLKIKSNIKGGTVDLFLFDPEGTETRITIGSSNFTKKIKVTKGLWAYNCSGIFKEGGSIHITGTVKEKVKEVFVEQEKKKETLEQAKTNTVIDLKNQNTYNISESGSFQVNSDQTLTLKIKSSIKGGTVDLFLFSPEGKEKRITIGSKNKTKKIKVTEGVWAYNCSGIFKEGGKLRITGTLTE